MTSFLLRVLGVFSALFSLTAWANNLTPNLPAISAPLATQALLVDIKKLNQGLIAVGEQGIIIYKTHAADPWQQAQVPVNSLLTSVSFINSQVGLVVGHQGVILRSENAGKTWQLIRYQADSPPLLSLGFINENLGFALGAYGLLLKTEDGGKSWEDVSDILPNDEGMHLNTWLVDEEQTIYLAGEAGNLFISKDLGGSWQHQDISEHFHSIFNLSLGLEKQVYLTGLRGSLGVSYNQGKSWQTLPLATSESLNFSLPLANHQLVLVGQNGRYLYGEAKHLQQGQLATRASLVALAELDGEFYAVGKGGVHKLPLKLPLRLDEIPSDKKENKNE